MLTCWTSEMSVFSSFTPSMISGTSLLESMLELIILKSSTSTVLLSPTRSQPPSPVALALPPLANTMSPRVPSVFGASPVFRRIEPDEPASALPVVKLRAPLTPFVPLAAVRRKMPPLDVEDPAPAVRLIEPPECEKL